jgi:uncharacterized damage-inducible protein DinB
MSDFLAPWQLSRGRFIESLSSLSHSQLSWRMHEGTLTVAEMALHVAGVEASFALQLLGQTPEGTQAKLVLAATDGVVNEKSFPYSAEEMTLEAVLAALEESRTLVQPLLENPTPFRERTIKSALGPMIDGNGAFARLCFHAGYHQGQVHFIRTSPGFPG